MNNSRPRDPEELRATAVQEFASLADRRSRILTEQLERVIRWDWYTSEALHPLPLYFHRTPYWFPLGRLLKKEPKHKSNKVLYGVDADERPVIQRSYMKPSELGYHEEAWVYTTDRLWLYGFDYHNGSPQRVTVAWRIGQRVVAEAVCGEGGHHVVLYQYDDQDRPIAMQQLAAEEGEPLGPHSTFRAEYDGFTVVRVTQFDDRPGEHGSEVVFPATGYR